MVTQVVLLATIVVMNAWMVVAQTAVPIPPVLIPAPLEKCPAGEVPLADSNGVELFCGRGSRPGVCPTGSFCNVHPTDRFAVCCPALGRERCCPLPSTIQSLGSQRCDRDAQCAAWGQGLKCCVGDRNFKVCINKPVECCCPANNTADRCLTDHLCDADSDCHNGQVCCTTTPPCRLSRSCRCGSFRQCQDPEPCPCVDVCCPKFQPRFNPTLPGCTRDAECREGEKCCLTCCGGGGQCVPGLACQRPIITPCQNTRFNTVG